MERERIEIPYAPRIWAKKLHASFARWAALILHRRAGKTTGFLNHHQRAATDDGWEMARLRFLLPDAPEAHLRPLLRHRVYWHVMPTVRQAKMVAWDMLKDFSAPLVGRGLAKQNNSELHVTYWNGNKVQLIGADDPDSLRGPGLSGVSLDEYSQIDPRAFGEVISKALGDHLGYALFGGTIKGKDQLYRIYEAAKDNPEWYAVWQAIDESLATEQGPTITALNRAMQDDRKLVLQSVMTQAEFDQEWYLALDAAIKGAFYLDQLAAAQREGRLTRVPYDAALPVDTDWDLGIDDLLTIWFSQSLRTGEVRLIDYYETAGKGIPEVVRDLKDRPYTFGTHWAPHDIAVKELGTGKSRLDVAKEHGLRFTITPRLHGAAGYEVSEGIKAARLLMGRCWWDAEKCARGLEALRHYKATFSKQLGQFTGVPVHDWASHGADAFRGLAVRHKVPRPKDELVTPYVPVSAWG